MLGILVPFILWISRKDKIKNINKLGKELINFEIAWTIILFLIPFLLFLLTKTGLLESLILSIIFIVTGCMYFINLIFVFFNMIRISNEKDVVYYPKIRFLR